MLEGVITLIFEILLLVAALSVDSLAASVSYGLAKIKIGFTRSLLISIICSMFLVFSAAFAGVIGAYIDEEITKTVSFLILFVIGIIKLMEKDKSERPETLSASKTVLFAVSMSAGQLLGYMGDTGYSEVEGTTGNFPVHLHFGMYLDLEGRGEVSFNPYYLLNMLEKKKLKYVFNN